MKSTFCLIGLLTLVGATSAQNTRPLPPKTIREAISGRSLPVAPSTTNQASHSSAPPTNPYFCPPRSCLYYTGDFDTANPNDNALIDIDNSGIGVDAEVWVGVQPTTNATITGVANYVFLTGDYGNGGTNPTPFAVRTGISAGNPGKLVCSTHGNATLGYYGGPCLGSAPCEVYYITKLAKSCHLKAGKIYFVDMTPQYNNDSTEGFLMDQEDLSPRLDRENPPFHNQIGWPILWDASYFTSSTYGANYEPTWGSAGACGGAGCDAFDIALTGKK